jgi:hypothetical protein
MGSVSVAGNSAHAVGVRVASTAQHAVRLLFLLRDAGESTQCPPDPADAVRVVRTEVRLHALDFWLRNPDYLADELLNEVEAGRLDESFVTAAVRLLDEREPQLRRYPMHRWLFGAYEPLDDAMALLEIAGMASIRRVGRSGHVARTSFFLLSAGMAAANRLEASAESLSWYPHQIRLVLAIARDEVGSRLKQRQYRQAEYAGTELGSRIAPIAVRVRRRLTERVGQVSA